MGISKAALKILLKEAKRRPFSGRFLALGRQDMWFNEKTLRQSFAEFNARLPPGGWLPESAVKPTFRDKGFLSDKSVYRALGFSHGESMDFSSYEGAEVIHDMNSLELPESCIGTYDMVFDGGTSEHVFHFPNFLLNVHRLLRVGGRVMHVSPSSNFLDHGFYMFSPTLFWDYYVRNGYEPNSFFVVAHTQNHDTEPWELSEYTPGCLDSISFGGLDDRLYGVACVFTKTSASTGGVIPQQGMYVRAWRSSAPPVQGAISSSSLGFAARLRFGLAWRWDRIKEVLLPLCSRFSRLTQKKGLGLKVIDRY